MTYRHFFTSSSVLPGHPDKLCDRISDALIDAYLSADPEAQVRAEVAVAGQVVFLVTEVAARGEVDMTGVVRRTIAETGYFPRDLDADRCAILAQSNVTASPLFGREGRRRDATLATTAVEQTTVFGYACSDTPERMPLPIQLAHQLSALLGSPALRQAVAGLGPDGEVQVTVEYADNRPVRIDTVVARLQSLGPPQTLLEAIGKLLFEPVFKASPVQPDRATRLIVNPGGPLESAGPARDVGHTGRKNADDTYGGAARHGGHALSGKDPGRLDRSASYAARHIATNVVAAGLAGECEVMLSYSIGQLAPTSVFARTFGGGVVPDEHLSRTVAEVFDLRPRAVETRLSLRPLPRERGGQFYQKLASGGHLGRPDLDLPWESLDAVDDLRRAAGAP